jgi:hypothetical protein
MLPSRKFTPASRSDIICDHSKNENSHRLKKCSVHTAAFSNFSYCALPRKIPDNYFRPPTAGYDSTLIAMNTKYSVTIIKYSKRARYTLHRVPARVDATFLQTPDPIL